MPTEFIPFIAVLIVLLGALVISIHKYNFLKNSTAGFILEDFSSAYVESILKLCKTSATALLADSDVAYPSVDDYIQATTEKVIELIRNYADDNDVEINLIKSFSNKQLAVIINNIVYFKSNEIISLYSESMDYDEEDEDSIDYTDYIIDGPVDPSAKDKVMTINDKVNIIDSVESFYKKDNEV